MAFDEDGPAEHRTLFGLPPHPRPRVVIQAVPFDATTSSRPGTADCVSWVREASEQVDLYHPVAGPFWERGVVLQGDPGWIRALSAAARECVEAVRAGGEGRAEVDAAGSRIDAFTHSFASSAFDAGQIPGLLGGDHSIPQGAIRAALQRWPGLGVLHVDAHADLREAYEGFRYSHASIFHNVLADGLGCLVQIGIRDRCRAEAERQRTDPRIFALSDASLAARLDRGTPFADVAAEVVGHLPDAVWVSFDIDGLDPSLCPNTGTPVPGGLSWRETRILLDTLGRSGKTIVGFDLCEVGPAPWDANVASRILFDLAGWAIHTGDSP